MFSDGPNSSWHPAMMPNSDHDLLHDHTPEVAQEPLPVLSKLNVEEAQEQHAGSDGWFPDYETGGASLNHDHAETSAEVATDEHAEPVGASKETDEATESGEKVAEDAEQSSSSQSKHVSSMSFARTVSHEPSWNDDDDPEWNLTRAGTDPFKFMPPNERTNSFPDAPPVQHDEAAFPDHPLPSNQAEDIMNEVEQADQEDDEDFFARAANEPQEGGFLDQKDADVPSDPHQYAGGDLHGTAEEAAEARYAEGVPLISHAEPATEEGGNLFADDVEGADEDFFTQVHSAEGFAPSTEPAPSLERKSTAQVILGGQQALGGSGFVALPDTVEEHVHMGHDDMDEDAFAIALAAERMNENQARKTEDTEDLDAKWKEMFAGDDGDELLLDDADDKKEVDPAAFFGSDDEGFLDDGDEHQWSLNRHTAPKDDIYPPDNPQELSLRQRRIHIYPRRRLLPHCSLPCPLLTRPQQRLPQCLQLMAMAHRRLLSRNSTRHRALSMRPKAGTIRHTTCRWRS
jgi:COPII coat assembly protein SEC16